MNQDALFKKAREGELPKWMKKAQVEELKSNAAKSVGALADVLDGTSLSP
jgi:hypothetical protein